MKRTTKAFATTFFGAGLGLAAMTSPLAAQTATYLDTNASHCEIFRSVSRLVPSSCARAGDREVTRPRTRGLRTRSIRFHEATSDQAAPHAAAAATSEPVEASQVATAQPAGKTQVAAVEQESPPKELAVAVPVPFAFDSFRLTDEAKAILDRIAGVLTDDLLQDKVVEIEGHADAHGPDAYNLSLSQLRARSVRAYLIEQHGVSPERLPFVGKGETEPYYPADPYAGANRRVEFHNLSG